MARTKNRETKAARQAKRRETWIFRALLVVALGLFVGFVFVSFFQNKREINWTHLAEGIFVPAPSQQESPVETQENKQRIGRRNDSLNSDPEQNEDPLAIGMAALTFDGINPNLTEEQKRFVRSGYDFTQLHNKAFAVYDVKTKTYLAGRNMETSLPPASLTKVMTCYTALAREPMLDRRFKMPAEIFDWIYDKDLSVAGFEVGEEASLEQLIYAAMLPSGADGCLGMAYGLAGSQDKFVEWMNEDAKKLGLTQTHFENCVGSDATDHYSSARDLVQLFERSLRLPDFEKAASALSYVVPSNRVRKENLNLFSSVILPIRDEIGIPDGVTLAGGKTGYTEDAGSCLIIRVQKRDRDFILCVLNSGGDQGAAEQCMELAEHFLR